MGSDWTFLLFRCEAFGTKLRLNHTCCLTKDLQKMAEESWNEIKRSNLRFSRINLSSTPQTKWTAPTPDSYKINYDGALSNADNKSGIGVVVRDCHGDVIASLVQQLDQAYQPVEVEALAACRAVEFGSELGLHRATVEGDSEVVVKALRYKEYGLAPYAHLIKDVSLFSGLYSEFSYSRVKRNSKKIAHNLTRLVLTTQNYTVWKEDVPSYILPFI